MDHKFIIRIDDGFCEWEYVFSKPETCINDFVEAIETKMDIKREGEKLISDYEK